MYTLGIDVAKATLAVTLLHPAGHADHFACANTPAGFATLDAWLQQHGRPSIHACMEATNVYWEALATWLHAQGIPVSVGNPARIKGFAQALLQRTKTDRQDSLVLAQFCAKHRPPLWTPSTPEQRALRDLVRLRQDLLQNRLQHQNRLLDTTNPTVQAVLQSVLTALETAVAEVEQQIAAQVAAVETLREQVALLTTIKGIGTVTATLILAEMPHLAQYPSATAAAAAVGVTPSHYESGTSVRRRPRMSKVGKSTLRAGLFLPALAAKRWCPELRAFAERLSARHKHKMVVIGAVMRKLIHICYGILKHHTPYDPTKVGPTHPVTT